MAAMIETVRSPPRSLNAAIHIGEIERSPVAMIGQLSPSTRTTSPSSRAVEARAAPNLRSILSAAVGVVTCACKLPNRRVANAAREKPRNLMLFPSVSDGNSPRIGPKR